MHLIAGMIFILAGMGSMFLALWKFSEPSRERSAFGVPLALFVLSLALVVIGMLAGSS
jgi:hypothetical protein